MSRGPGRIKCGQTRAMIDRAKVQGFRVERRGNNHLTVYGPDGGWVATISSTTGDQKSHLPVRSALRRAGYQGV